LDSGASQGTSVTKEARGQNKNGWPQSLQGHSPGVGPNKEGGQHWAKAPRGWEAKGDQPPGKGGGPTGHPKKRGHMSTKENIPGKGVKSGGKKTRRKTQG